MSTRAAIIVKDKNTMRNLYQHYDGYPDGLGKQLKDFLKTYINEKTINVDSLTMSIVDEGIAEHTNWIHSDEEYLYIIDCDQRRLTGYNVGFSWAYHNQFNKNGKTDYCAWAKHIDINDIQDPIVELEYSFIPSKGNKINIIDTLDEVGMLYLGLAGLISAEVLIDEDSCVRAKEHLEMFKRDLPASNKSNDEFVTRFLRNAEDIIERERQRFSQNKNLLN